MGQGNLNVALLCLLVTGLFQSCWTSARRLTQTLVGVLRRGPPPRPVVVEGLADAAVVSLGVVFAVADQPSCVRHTLAGVAVTLAPEAAKPWLAHVHNWIRVGVKVKVRVEVQLPPGSRRNRQQEHICNEKSELPEKRR